MFIKEFERLIFENDTNELMKLIINTNDINECNELGMNALFLSVIHHNLFIFNFLLQHGINSEHVDPSNQNIFSYITWEKALSFGKALIAIQPDFFSKQRDTMPLLISIKNGNKDMVHFLLTNGMNVNEYFPNGETPLTFAIHHKNEEMIHEIIQLGADVNQANRSKESPLLQAIHYEQIETAKLLLAFGANPNHFDLNGTTPLIACCQNNQIELANLLVKKGSHIDHRDLFGRTALFWATFNGFSKLIAYLLFRGANLNIQDIADFTPFELLIYDKEIQNKSEMIPLFIRYVYKMDDKNLKILEHNRLRLLFV